jgi:uncharacterized repeat protein (TIGR03843 family)
VLFDLLANNADRKGSHVFFEKSTRHLYAIDHGLCFNVEEKLRTVIWDFAGEQIADEQLAAVQTIITPSATLVNELLCYLNADELSALALRAEALARAAVFPQPPANRRAFPYPPL